MSIFVSSHPPLKYKPQVSPISYGFLISYVGTTRNLNLINLIKLKFSDPWRVDLIYLVVRDLRSYHSAKSTLLFFNWFINLMYIINYIFYVSYIYFYFFEDICWINFINFNFSIIKLLFIHDLEFKIYFFIIKWKNKLLNNFFPLKINNYIKFFC